jgi:tRNA 2-thiocytidine biosynthesis protein TtcA
VASEIALVPFPAPRPPAAGERPSRNFKRLQAELRGLVGKAIDDYAMIQDGDKVMVCLSGGKDSYTLLPARVLPDYLTALGVPFAVIEQDTYSVVKRVIPEGRTMCSLCSRLRRGALYRYAAEHGCTKIALGHHRDDILETLFLNLFYGGKLKAMPPKLLSDDARHIVIRPLAYVPERLIARYAKARRFPLIPCTLCGSQPNLQRAVVGRMLEAWEHEHPGRIESIFAALRDVAPSQLADPALFDFAGLEARRAAPGPDDEAGGGP